ncbi:MAG: hypothetical protein HYW48_10170 [Deltaproteobacteria bacterium]|nr:hypothetical protein [Deltaproteobacteria bacterium]
MKKLLIPTLLSFLLNVCGADPDINEAPGVCPLSCFNAKIGSKEMQVRFLSEEISISCQGIADGQPYVGSVPISFVVESPERGLPAGKIVSGPSGATEDDPKPFDAQTVKGTPAPKISFEAVVIGGYLGSSDLNDVNFDNPDDDRYKYRGILTSMDEWCTDACGVGRVEIVPQCKSQVNTITLLVSSGPVSKEIKITVNP